MEAGFDMLDQGNLQKVADQLETRSHLMEGILVEMDILVAVDTLEEMGSPEERFAKTVIRFA